MLNKSKSRRCKRIISLILIATIITVGVVGDNYISRAKSSENRENYVALDNRKILSKDSLNLDFNEYFNDDVDLLSLNSMTGLKNYNDIKIADNTTVMAKISENLKQSFSKLPDNVNSDEEARAILVEFATEVAGHR